jgi:capsular exopolysaccharide synthesis family protein
MSKFFNDTMKSRQPSAAEQGFTIAGLQEEIPADVAIPEVMQPVQQAEPILPPMQEVQKVEIPASRLLPERFAGSESLKSAEESYRALRTRLMRLTAAKNLKSIVITSSVPGEGKTLTSLNLALCCSQLHDMRVLLVDGDIRTGGLTRSLGFTSHAGLAEVLSGKSDAESAILETNHPNLYVCGAGSSATPAPELYAGQAWAEFIAWSKESFSLVIVDSPPIMTMADVELMTAACDGALMVVRARHTRRDELQKSAGQIDAKKLLGIIYNAAEGARHNYYYAGPKDK